MEVLHLRNLGKSYSEIIAIVGCSHVSVARWLRIYHDNGLEGLKVINYNRRPGALKIHRGTLEDYLKTKTRFFEKM
ncbi:hypothetical protein SCG7086_AO_00140 [Chlamydiales bacterium SCGC AG-110-P3]|nr:hypothetical protein SCG7086_AO_00140 [Chlamydiales bacterium SCGC AG-110-P3]